MNTNIILNTIYDELAEEETTQTAQNKQERKLEEFIAKANELNLFTDDHNNFLNQNR